MHLVSGYISLNIWGILSWTISLGAHLIKNRNLVAITSIHKLHIVVTVDLAQTSKQYLQVINSDEDALKQLIIHPSVLISNELNII